MKKTIFCWLVILFVFSTSADLYSQNTQSSQPELNKTEKKDKPKKIKYWYEGENVRAIVGFEQAGASSAKSNQFFFSDLYFSQPFPIQFSKSKKNSDKIT